MLYARRIRHKGLKRLYGNGDRSGINPKWVDKIERVLAALAVAGSPEEMDFPGFGLHRLKYDRAGTYAVFVTRNGRVTFRWDSHGPYHVDLEDYHGR